MCVLNTYNIACNKSVISICLHLPPFDGKAVYIETVLSLLSLIGTMYLMLHICTFQQLETLAFIISYVCSGSTLLNRKLFIIKSHHSICILFFIFNFFGKNSLAD